jgi:hypothetical protein
MDRIGRMNGCIDTPFMTLATDGEWSKSCPTAFILEKEPPVPNGWVPELV